MKTSQVSLKKSLYTCSHNCVEINGKLKWPMQDKEANTVHLLGTSSTIRFTACPALITEAISILNLKQLKKPGEMPGAWLRDHRVHQDWWLSTSMTQH